MAVANLAQLGFTQTVGFEVEGLKTQSFRSSNSFVRRAVGQRYRDL